VTTMTDPAVRPFEVHVPDDDLADLRRRIAATRWPDKETVTDQSQGAQLAQVQELVRYWGTDYDWRKVEARPIVGLLGVVVEPVDERVLIDQAAIDNLVSAFDRKRAVAPCAMRQHHGAETPSLAQIVVGGVDAHPGQGDELDIWMVKTPVNLLVLVPALLHVPSRQPVLDFAEGTGVLFDHHYLRATFGQDVGYFCARGSGANHRDDVLRLFSACGFHHGP